MKLWLDDQINDPSAPPRHPPEGWLGVDSAIQACRLLARGGVTHISLDHDLGEGKFTGYLVALFIEKWAFQKRIKPLSWTIHSANPVGAEKMRYALSLADRFWGEGK